MRPRWGVSLERSSDWLDGPQSSPASSLAVVPRDGGSRRLHRRSRCKTGSSLCRRPVGGGAFCWRSRPISGPRSDQHFHSCQPDLSGYGACGRPCAEPTLRHPTQSESAAHPAFVANRTQPATPDDRTVHRGGFASRRGRFRSLPLKRAPKKAGSAPGELDRRVRASRKTASSRGVQFQRPARCHSS